MEWHEDDISPGELVQRCIDATRGLFLGEAVSLDAKVEPDLPHMVGDTNRLLQVLINLVSNASKFTKDGVVTLSASRDLRDDQSWLVLSVSDTGIGVPADKLDHVFEEFAQADDSTTREYGGTGLGLPLSRRLCQLMGGDLTVTSESGVGLSLIHI